MPDQGCCCIIRCWQCAICLRADGRKTNRREKDEVQASHLSISGVFGLCAGSSWSRFTIAAKLSVFDVGGVVFCQKFAEAAQLVCPYQSVLESYDQGRGMTLSTKLRIILMVSGLMGIGFVMMHNVPVGRVLLVLVWVFHLLYFSFGVKTLKAE